jgi:hypothetical protein
MCRRLLSISTSNEILCFDILLLTARNDSDWKLYISQFIGLMNSN